MKQPPAKRVDLMDIVVRSFVDLWSERSVILGLALLPILIKSASFFLIVMMDLQNDLLKQGLYFIPSYFVEGWFIAVCIRLVVFGEQWPFFLTGDDSEADQKRLERRRRAIKSCGIMYVLLKISVVGIVSIYVSQAELTQNVVMAELEHSQQAIQSGAAQDPSGLAFSAFAFIGATLLLLASIWAFRYTCLYVPLALGIRMKRFLRAVWGFRGSFHLIFISMFCFLPFFILFEVLHNGLSSLFASNTLEAGNFVYSGLFSIIQSAMDLLIGLMTSVALSYYIISAVNKQGKKA